METSLTEKQPIIEMHHVTKEYMHEGLRLCVLNEVSLSIYSGEMISIVGPSGAGKSTLLNILGTLDLPSSGSIIVQGDDVTRYTSQKLAHFRNQMMGFVFQFHHLLPEFNALENVMMPGMIRGWTRGERGKHLKTQAVKLLEEVGLSGRVTHRPGELSGGEQQRVALARALIMSPPIVLADEPTGNLDTQTGSQVHELMFHLNRTYGTTFVVVTHSEELASHMPRRVMMRDGRIEHDIQHVSGTPDTHRSPQSQIDDLPAPRPCNDKQTGLPRGLT